MKRETIVVIEDETDILDVIEYNLAREGYRIRAYRDGEEGLEAVRRHAPDLVLLDVMLPLIPSRRIWKPISKLVPNME